MVRFRGWGRQRGRICSGGTRGAGVPDAANTIAAMQIVYVIVAVDSLVTWAREGQVGAYLVAVATLVYMTQIVAVSVAAPGHPAPAPK